ncbi:MAG: hypothetical protein H6807_05890 [Planctomycetes bacterium]|nr:hypothetical protein [Planctomycetota bacterium]
MATEDGQERAERSAPVALPTFLVLSVLVAALAAGLVAVLAPLFGSALAAKVLVLAGVAGFAVSTAGWLIVLRGFTAGGNRMMAHFAAGLLTKLVLLGLVAILVSSLGIAKLDEFLLPFAAVFFITGFAQLGIAVKGATKLLNETRGPGTRATPAAPGAAVDRGERGSTPSS